MDSGQRIAGPFWRHGLPRPVIFGFFATTRDQTQNGRDPNASISNAHCAGACTKSGRLSQESVERSTRHRRQGAPPVDLPVVNAPNLPLFFRLISNSIVGNASRLVDRSPAGRADAGLVLAGGAPRLY